MLNEDEWIGKWTKWCENGNFRINKHVILDKQVVHEDELSSALKDFTILNPVEGVINILSLVLNQIVWRILLATQI